MFVCSYKRCQVENVPPKKPRKILKGKGGSRLWNSEGMGGNAFWNFRRQGGLKPGSRPWLGMDIFWICPLLQFNTLSKHIKY